jgi:Cd2+/Zn2+-exporting ATPase
MGELRVTEVVPLGTATAGDVLRLGAAVESRSAHPVAAAVLEEARRAGISVPLLTAFVSHPGLGAEADVDGRHVLVGNARLMTARGVAMRIDDRVDALERDGRSVVFVAIDQAIVGAIAVADRPRQSAREAIDLLRAHGVRRIVLLTGDHHATTKSLAPSLGIDEWHAALMPEQKHEIVSTMRARGDVVLMVGDGVNDAPALAAADVGAAMAAAGSDVALETADVALMSNELLKLPYALRLARATLSNVRTNVAISLVLKVAFLALTIAGLATLWMAVLADTGATVIVVGNALRLLRAR